VDDSCAGFIQGPDGVLQGSFGGLFSGGLLDLSDIGLDFRSGGAIALVAFQRLPVAFDGGLVSIHNLLFIPPLKP